MKESDVDISPISNLPDDVVLAILNEVTDLKTLCLCQVVSKRFYAIVRQVNTIRAFHSLESGDDWLKSISMFKILKSVVIQISYDNDNPSNGYLCKWKVKVGLNRIDSFVIVSPTSIYDNKGLLLYEQKHNEDNFFLSMCCLLDALLRVFMSWRIMILDIPLLEKISITDLDNRGIVSLNGREAIDELRNWKSISFPHRVSECYLPSLELPVSGYVMKGVTLVLVENKDLPDDGNYDRFIDDHEIDFNKHDKEEVVYHEAMMGIFKKHTGSIVRKPPNDKWVAGISSFLEDIQK